MAALAGVELPANRNFDGMDLSPVLFCNTALPERTLYWRFNKNRALRYGKWKLHLDGDGRQPLIFDLEADIGETVDVSSEYPVLVNKLVSDLASLETEVTRGVTIIA
jgi:arylsulfatase A-like enzyme